VVVQQQALRDFDQAMRNFFGGTHRKPTWHKAGQHEGFRVADARRIDVRRLSHKVGAVFIPKIGRVRFRWSRAVVGAKSFRVTRDRSGRWHVSFAVMPDPVCAPATGEVVGIDRGVTVSAALSTSELLHCPGLNSREAERLLRLQRKLAKAKRGSNRRAALKLKIARIKATQVDRRKDWAEKTSTELARRFDVIRFEDLRIKNMTKSAKGTVESPGTNVRQKAGLNRSILSNGWGLLLKRTQDKAPGRVELVNPAYTSQTCNRCKRVDPKSRKNQADFECTACGHRDHADVNAAKNIAAGHAVTARGGVPLGKPANREPQQESRAILCSRHPAEISGPMPARKPTRPRTR
jgi:putative transposase